MSELLTIWGYDAGDTTKVGKFFGNDQGQLWHSSATFPKPIPSIETPRDCVAERFMPLLITRLMDADHWSPPNALHGFSICGPVIRGNTCLRLINRNISTSFSIEGDAALNDGMAATIASMKAGVAKDHKGAVVLLTLGSGVGFGSFHWNAHDPQIPNNGETHFDVRGSNLKCQCKRRGCFEAAVNERALRHYLTHALERDAAPPYQDDTGGLGITIEHAIQQTDHRLHPHRTAILQSLNSWYILIGRGISNILALLNIGGSVEQPPPIIVLAGGLSALIDEEQVKHYTHEPFEHDCLVGNEIIVRKENKLGNFAGCIGAACMALANHLNKDVTQIDFLPSAPH